MLADTIATHPKIIQAGTLVGEYGRERALALFVEAIGYARHYLTDGFVPDAYISGLGGAKETANALAHPTVKLWHRARGGWRIHDFDHWNTSAAQIKAKREKERRRVAAFRASKNGGRR